MTEQPPVAAPYLYERDLVAAFIASISISNDVFGIQDFGLEFNYQRGRTDVVAVSGDGRVIAFEAKLRDWREALHQAYRNTCFAVESYILMPLAAAERAAAHALEFENRGVGICTLSNGALKVLRPAPRHLDALEPQLRKRATDFASSSSSD